MCGNTSTLIPLHNFKLVNVTSFCHLELSSVIVYSTKDIHYKREIISYPWDPTLKFDEKTIISYQEILNLTQPKAIEDMDENIYGWFQQSHSFDILWVLLGVILTVFLNVLIYCCCKEKILRKSQSPSPPPQNVYDMFAAPLIRDRNNRP